MKGCDGSCGLFHPTVCRNSWRYQRCFIQDCTFVHLQGTERPDKNHYTHSCNKSNFNHNQDPIRYPNNYKKNYSSFAMPSNPPYSAENIPNNFDKPANRVYNYHKKDFPPLISTTESRMDKFSNSLLQLQKSVEYLMCMVPQQRVQSSTTQEDQNISNHNQLLPNQSFDAGSYFPFYNNISRNQAKN